MDGWWPAGDDPRAPAGEPTAEWSQVVDALLAADAVTAAGDWALARGQVDIAMELARRVLKRQRDADTLLAACRIAYMAARLDEARTWARELGEVATPGDAQRRLIDAIEERGAVLDRLDAPREVTTAGPPQARRVLAMLAYSLPYTSNGYATRSHGLLTAVRRDGWDVRPFTRPGYPGDADRQWVDVALPEHERIDALDYGRLLRAKRRQLGAMLYLLAAADEIGELVATLRPQLVHAASNYTTALPAYLAAREAGLPFVYEVRGFWDLTRSSSDPAFAGTAECRYLRLFERALLERADAVITLTESMRSELVRRGSPPDRIEVAPNAVDVDRLDPVPRDAALARQLGIPDGVPVIGYVGSFVDYEGLDDLVDACAALKRAGRVFHLLLVGDGLTWSAVSQRVDEAGLQGCATLPGRVPHDRVAAYYALMDLCPFPRKPWPVCELVSPLKPFEAMAQGKAVLVSSVAAMAESVHEGVNGAVFDKGEPARLADELARWLDDPGGARALGRRARQWVRDERTWPSSAAAVARAYEAAIANHARAAQTGAGR